MRSNRSTKTSIMADSVSKGPEASVVSKNSASAAAKRNALAIITNISPAEDHVLLKPLTTKPRTKRAVRVTVQAVLNPVEEKQAVEAAEVDSSIPGSAPALQAEKSTFDVGAPIDEASMTARPLAAMLPEVDDHQAFPESSGNDDHEDEEESDDACDALCIAIQGLTVQNDAKGVHTRFVDDEDGNLIAVKSPRNVPHNQHIRFEEEEDDEAVVIKTPKA